MIKRHTFENGFQLVYQPSEQAIPLTCIHLFCNVGSAYEMDPIRGASHFVEHMCFKGTHKHMKPQNLLVEYNKIGAHINAYTEKRITCYTLTADDTHTDTLVHTFADMIMNASFPHKEFAKEQHVVVEENIRNESNHSYMLEKALDTLYFRGSSYEHPIDIITYHPNATHLKYDDIVQWYHWFYRPSNMVCSVISNLPFKKICNIIESSAFMKGEKHSAAPLYLYPTLTLQPINEHFIYYKKKGISSTIVNVGFRTCNYYSNDKYILQLLSHVLNGFSGKLFTAFRTKHGLTYHSSAHTRYHEHTGYMNFFIQTDPTKLIMDGKKEGILPILIGLICDLIHHGITEDDIKRAKGNCKGKVLMELQSIDSLASYNGVNAVFQHQPGMFQNLYKTHIESITVKQVNDNIRKYMIYENLVVGIAYEKDIPKQTIEKLFSVI